MMKKFLLLLLLSAGVLTVQAADEKYSLPEILPAQLVKSDGSPVKTADALKGKKFVLLYFSASWCSPCRSFTPVLAEFYRQTNAEVEVIFISSDRSWEDMTDYLKKMPWKAVIFDSPVPGELKKLFKIRWIPTLIALDSRGKVVSKNARRDVTALGVEAVKKWQNPNYKPKKAAKSAVSDQLLKNLPKQLVNGDGELVNTAEYLKNKKYIALYFSASWCSPCKKFTPKLVKFYKKKQEEVAVIFVSSDNSEDKMTGYLKKMPWLAIPYNSTARGRLKALARTRGIPTLVIVDANGKVISDNARFDVEYLGTKAVKEWEKTDYKPRTFKNRKKRNSGNVRVKAYKSCKGRTRP